MPTHKSKKATAFGGHDLVSGLLDLPNSSHAANASTMAHRQPSSGMVLAKLRHQDATLPAELCDSDMDIVAVLIETAPQLQ